MSENTAPVAPAPETRPNESATFLTKREVIAAGALQGLLANPNALIYEPGMTVHGWTLEALAVRWTDHLINELNAPTA